MVNHREGVGKISPEKGQDENDLTDFFGGMTEDLARKVIEWSWIFCLHTLDIPNSSKELVRIGVWQPYKAFKTEMFGAPKHLLNIGNWMSRPGYYIVLWLSVPSYGLKMFQVIGDFQK